MRKGALGANRWRGGLEQATVYLYFTNARYKTNPMMMTIKSTMHLKGRADFWYFSAFSSSSTPTLVRSTACEQNDRGNERLKKGFFVTLSPLFKLPSFHAPSPYCNQYDPTTCLDQQ
jgi:hypothetical protein